MGPAVLSFIVRLSSLQGLNTIIEKEAHNVCPLKRGFPLYQLCHLFRVSIISGSTLCSTIKQAYNRQYAHMYITKSDIYEGIHKQGWLSIRYLFQYVVHLKGLLLHGNICG